MPLKVPWQIEGMRPQIVAANTTRPPARTTSATERESEKVLPIARASGCSFRIRPRGRRARLLRALPRCKPRRKASTNPPPTRNASVPRPNRRARPPAARAAPTRRRAPTGSEEDPDLPQILQRLSKVKRKVLVLSGKGGVGKSTMTAQLGFALAGQGLSVGLLDVDICGPSIPQMLGLKGTRCTRPRPDGRPCTCRRTA